MTRHSASKARCLSVALFTALITILFSMTSLAQVKNSSHLSAAPARLSPKQSRATSMDGGTPLFLSPVVYDTGGVEEAGFVTTADLNGDGIPDLIVANSYVSDTIAVFLGRGDGTFSGGGDTSSGGGAPLGIVAVDINGDGLVDLVVINYFPCYGCSGDGLVEVLLGSGNGSFYSRTTYDSNGVGPSSIAVADMNGDGKLDIVVANCAPSWSSTCGDGNGAVAVLLGKGDGTFGPAATYDSGITPGGPGLALADLNHDGKVDVVVNSSCIYDEKCGPAEIGVLLGNGDGTLRPGVSYALAGGGANAIAVADLNGDGNPDVLVSGCGSSNCFGQNGLVSVLLGNGDGTVGTATGYDAGERLADGIAVADVTGDGKLDLLVVDAIDASIGVLPGNGNGTFQPPLLFPTVAGSDISYSVAVADFNGDGKPDLAVTSLGKTSGLVSVLMNSGTFTYDQTSTALASSENPAGKKEMVTYTATVTAADGRPVTGTVRFVDGSSSFISEEIVNGQATYTTHYDKVADHTIVAAYVGDTTLSSSTARLTEVIGKKPFASVTALASSGSPSLLGQPVTFTATVTSIYGTIPNGEIVTFYDGSNTIGTGKTSNGVATFTTSSLTVGTHPINATYAGDGMFKTSRGKVKQIVTQ